MSTAAVLSLLAFCLATYKSATFLALNPRRGLNRRAALLALSIAAITFSDFGFRTSTELTQLSFYRAVSFFWPLLPLAFFDLGYAYAGLKRGPLYWLLGPAVAGGLIWIEFSTEWLSLPPIQTAGGFFYNPTLHPPTQIALALWGATLTLGALWLTQRRLRRRGDVDLMDLHALGLGYGIIIAAGVGHSYIINHAEVFGDAARPPLLAWGGLIGLLLIDRGLKIKNTHHHLCARVEASRQWRRALIDEVTRKTQALKIELDITRRVEVETRRLERQLKGLERLRWLSQLTTKTAARFAQSLERIEAAFAGLSGWRPPEIEEERRIIRESLQRGHELIQLLEQIRPEQTRAPLALDDFVRQERGFLERFIPPHARLDFALERCPEITLNALELRRALMNLITNAGAAVEAGEEIWITTRAACPPGRSGRWARLSVIDAGRGMTPEVQARAFEPLFSTKPGGTGQGLAMLKEFIDGVGGQVELRSVEGEGTTFHLYFEADEAPSLIEEAYPPDGFERRPRSDELNLAEIM